MISPKGVISDLIFLVFRFLGMLPFLKVQQFFLRIEYQLAGKIHHHSMGKKIVNGGAVFVGKYHAQLNHQQHQYNRRTYQTNGPEE